MPKIQTLLPGYKTPTDVQTTATTSKSRDHASPRGSSLAAPGRDVHRRPTQTGDSSQDCSGALCSREPNLPRGAVCCSRTCPQLRSTVHPDRTLAPACSPVTLVTTAFPLSVPLTYWTTLCLRPFRNWFLFIVGFHSCLSRCVDTKLSTFCLRFW